MKRCVGMPSKKFVDGPVSGDPKAVADGWQGLPEVIDRVCKGERLIIDHKDPDSQTVLPSRENMIRNSSILTELARDMSRRGRCGADPIDVIAEMTVAFYQKNPVYQRANPEFNMKVVAYNNAWGIHKMMSRLRTSLSKHKCTRAPRLRCHAFLV